MNGYVLAGGKSSRMGRDKALLLLAGRPLIDHAVAKLREVCSDVFILSGVAELEVFAPLVRDVHPGCGPLGGIEAALLQATTEWNLFVPVDVPFLTVDLLRTWAAEVVSVGSARVAMFTVDGLPQPTVCLLHREVLPYVQEAIERKEFKLLPALRGAGMQLAVEMGVERVFLSRVAEDGALFVNLNTPEEFAEAEGRLI